jgi:hypothetical protein
LSLLLVLHVLDQHFIAPWQQGGTMCTSYLRRARRKKGLTTWRIVRLVARAEMPSA